MDKKETVISVKCKAQSVKLELKTQNVLSFAL